MRPTTKEPGSPGLVVTEIESTFSIFFSQISLTNATIFSLCKRDATSGKTHQYGICCWICEYITILSTLKIQSSLFIIARDVSSQLVSIANVFINFSTKSKKNLTKNILVHSKKANEFLYKLPPTIRIFLSSFFSRFGFGHPWIVLFYSFFQFGWFDDSEFCNNSCNIFSRNLIKCKIDDF